MLLLNKIKKTIPELPEKDVLLASSFLEKRDFLSLYDLVSSCIKRIAINERKENPNPIYQQLDVEKLHELEAAVLEYLRAIDPDWMTQGDDSEEDANEEY